MIFFDIFLTTEIALDFLVLPIKRETRIPSTVYLDHEYSPSEIVGLASMAFPSKLWVSLCLWRSVTSRSFRPFQMRLIHRAPKNFAGIQ